MRKRLTTVILASFVLTNLFGMTAAALCQEKVVFNVGSAWPSSTEIATHFRTTFFSMMNDGTNGKVELVWKSGPSMIAARDLPSSASAGVIDIFLSSPGYLAGIIKEGAVWDAYPLYRSYRSSPEEFEEIAKLLNPIHAEKAKVKLLALNNIHRFYIWTKKPVGSFDELKGLKIRAHGGFVPYVVRALGAVPTTIPTAEVYMALERGVVDGSARPLTSLQSYKEYEVVRYGIDETITWGTGLIYVSLRAWEELDEDLQTDIMDICHEFNVRTAEYWQNKHDSLRKEFRDKERVSWYRLNAQEQATWEARVKAGAEDGIKSLSPTVGPKIAEVFARIAD
jgi:TRAP-type C4-dicarboxylate transport system substrate-binding protein